MSTKQEISQQEDYLLSTNKEDFLKKLIKGTDSYYYYSMLYALNKFGTSLPEEYENMLHEYQSKFYYSHRQKAITARRYLLKLEAKKDKEDCIKQINNSTWEYSFQYDKPHYAESSIVDTVDESKQKGLSQMDASIFSIQSYLDEAFTSETALAKIDDDAFHLLDLNKLKVASANVFDRFLQRASLYEIPEAPTLLRDYEKLKLATDKNYELSPSFFVKLTFKQMKELQELCPHLNKNKNFIGTY